MIAAFLSLTLTASRWNGEGRTGNKHTAAQVLILETSVPRPFEFWSKVHLILIETVPRRLEWSNVYINFNDLMQTKN